MFANSQLSEKNGASATITVGNWMGLDAIGFLSCIPFLGTIAAIVIYIIILCSGETAPSIRNRLVANIIWSCIGLVFAGIILAIILGIGLSAGGAIKTFLEENLGQG